MQAEPPDDPPPVVVAPADAPAPPPHGVRYVESRRGERWDQSNLRADVPYVPTEPAELDFGVGAFFLVGGGAGGYVGVSPFLVDGVSPGWFLRPSVGLAQSVATNVRSTFASARLDGCWQMQGRYAQSSGMSLGLCAGPDLGISYVSPGTNAGSPAAGQTLPYLALGPSVELRADAAGVAFALRAGAGIDVVHAGFTDVTGARVDDSIFTWRLELALSWDLHGRPPESTPPP